MIFQYSSKQTLQPKWNAAWTQQTWGVGIKPLKLYAKFHVYLSICIWLGGVPIVWVSKQSKTQKVKNLKHPGAFLVAQKSLVWEDPTWFRATKPMHHDYWACALELGSSNYWAHIPQLLEPWSLCSETREDTAKRSPLPATREKPAQRLGPSTIQLLSHVRLFVTPWSAARQASLSITNSQNSLRLTSIKSVMPSSHLILCRPLLLLPPIPPSIRVFSNESTLHMRWPKYWSFSFSIIISKGIPGLISFRMDWLDLLAVQGTLKSLLQHHSSKHSQR